MNKLATFQYLSAFWFFSLFLFGLYDSTNRILIDTDFYLFSFLLSAFTFIFALYLNNKKLKH